MYKITEEKNIKIFILNDEINSYYEEFASKIKNIIEEFSNNNVIIDFSQLQYINSASIGTIVKFVKELGKNNINFSSCSMNSHIYNVFRITSLLKFIHYSKKKKEAIEYLT